MPLMEPGWFCELLEERTAFAVRVSDKLLDEVSEFQLIEVFDSEALGRILVLDHCFMVTEKDHFVYHEMLVHTPMAAAPDARRILIIGGGDGGAVTEAVKYPHVESITLCEIDPLVVSTCRKYFPAVSAGLDDPRVKIVNEDGAAYVRDLTEDVDLILVDSTDPVGPGAALFSHEFYRSVRSRLSERGVAVFQTESPTFMPDTFAMAAQNLMDVFGPSMARPYLITVPTYPGALWSFTFCSKTLNPLNVMHSRIPACLEGRLRYYDLDVHRAAFALPVFVRKLLEPR
jgi:spermidine synthase